MDTNFFINPQGNSNNLVNNKTGKKASYIGSKDTGLQQDTVNFTGKHIKKQGNWKSNLLALLGITSLAGSLTGCSSDKKVATPSDATPSDATIAETTPEVTPQPDLDEKLNIEDSYRAPVPEFIEDYESIQELYLPKGITYKTVTFAPTNIPKGVIQTVVTPENDDEGNALEGSTIKALIDKAYNIDEICEENGIENTDGVWHNFIHEYLQSNPDLASHIAELNNVDDISELTDDVIADTVLYPDENLPMTLHGVIAPTVKLPIATFGEADDMVNTTVVQRQYSPESSTVRIDANDEAEDGSSFKTTTSAIVDKYGLTNENNKDFYDIVFAVANDEENKELVETYLRKLNIATAVDEVESPEDNKRVQAQIGRAHV